MIRDSVYGVGQVEERTGDCVYDNSNARAAQFRRKPSRISRGKRDSHVLHVSDSHVRHVSDSHVRHVSDRHVPHVIDSHVRHVSDSHVPHVRVTFVAVKVIDLSP